jgi:fructose-bisphosphate aldolase class 1
MSSGIAKECRTCRHFLSVPMTIEAAVPGLASLSSGYASVRADDGLCALHDRYVAARSVCDSYSREDWHDVT